MVLTGSAARGAALAALAFGVGLGLGVARAAKDPALVFGADAGAVLTFVDPARTAAFEGLLDQVRLVLESSEDPIRQQQAEHWRVFRSSDPGPDGSTLYVGFMEPVLKGANYNLSDLLLDELPEAQAGALVEQLESYLTQPQRTLDLETFLDLSAPIRDADATP